MQQWLYFWWTSHFPKPNFIKACPLCKLQYNSINYVINSSFGKVGHRKLLTWVSTCLTVYLHSRLLPYVNVKCLKKFSTTDNVLCHVCVYNAVMSQFSNLVKFFFFLLLFTCMRVCYLVGEIQLKRSISKSCCIHPDLDSQQPAPLPHQLFTLNLMTLILNVPVFQITK